jgi:predicted alpha/beta hydrolase family esterase
VRTAALHVEAVHRDHLITAGTHLRQPMHWHRPSMGSHARFADRPRRAGLRPDVSIETRQRLEQSAGATPVHVLIVQHSVGCGRG